MDQLIAMLAERLSACVPDGLRVEARERMLIYSDANGRSGESGSYVHANWGAYGDTREDNLVGLSVQVLSELQDYVSEATTEPWPGTSRQPTPHAEVSGPNLYLWYGERDDAAVTCDPIPLSGILSKLG